MKHFVIGGGQLGSAVVQQLPAAAVTVASVDWTNHARARDQLARQVTDFLITNMPSTVSWCAGAGVVGSPESSLRRERDLLQVVLDTCASQAESPSRLFLASSAGGVYAGNHGICTERTVPAPTSDYGRSKLLQEAMVSEWAGQAGVDVLIGRISNLYGPRQNLDKRQGFISHLLRSMRSQQPFVYSVPASTIRDFVYTDDVALRVAAWLQRPNRTAPRATVKILAAERSLSLVHVSVTASRVTHRSARVLFAPQRGTDQPAIIRFQSTDPYSITGSRAPTTLEHGLWLTWQATLRSK